MSSVEESSFLRGYAGDSIPDNLKALLCPPPRTQPELQSPRVLLYYGPKKQGKTRILAALPNCRIVDMEPAGGGTKYLGALPYEPYRPQTVEEVEEFCKACAQHKPYGFVAFDPIDTLEDWAIERSTAFFRSTPIGKAMMKPKVGDPTWDGQSILTVPGRDGGGGPGWQYLRAEMRKLLLMTMTVADRVIWIGHLKDKFGEDKPERETFAADLDLIGKARAMATGWADAYALVIRDSTEPGKLMMTFRYKGKQVRGGGGGRCDHLEGKEICISEQGKDGKIGVRWELVYPELAQPASTTTQPTTT